MQMQGVAVSHEWLESSSAPTSFCPGSLPSLMCFCCSHPQVPIGHCSLTLRASANAHECKRMFENRWQVFFLKLFNDCLFVLTTKDHKFWNIHISYILSLLESPLMFSVHVMHLEFVFCFLESRQPQQSLKHVLEKGCPFPKSHVSLFSNSCPFVVSPFCIFFLDGSCRHSFG